MKKIIEYLDQRKVEDKDYREYLISGDTALKEFCLASHKSFDFMVSHFLDNSSKRGYGLIATNEWLQLPDDWMAIGLIEGDDIICMDLTDGSIYLWMIQTGNGEYLKVADSFKELLAMVINR